MEYEKQQTYIYRDQVWLSLMLWNHGRAGGPTKIDKDLYEMLLRSLQLTLELLFRNSSLSRFHMGM